MTFCRIPSQLTEEEKFLQQKYIKLKKKKKLLQQQKAPPKPEQTPVSTIQSQLKRGIDGQPKHGLDPKELAKKLIKSGAISAIVKPPEKEKQGFKRSKNSQRKKLEQQTDKPKYQPFSAASYKPSITSSLDLENDNSIGQRSSTSIFDSNNLPTKEKEAIAREETFREKRRDGKAHYVNRDIPNVGTIYVHGIGVNEQLLKNAFSQFGNIIKVNCEFNKNCGFVTFESIDQANRAIDSMNGTQVQNITLKVSLARKQAFVNKSSSLDSNNESTTENQNTSSSSTPNQSQQSNVFNNDWSSIASTYEQKMKPTKDKRSLVSYDDIY